MFNVPEKFRIRVGPMASDESYGNNGYFIIPSNTLGSHRAMDMIASDGLDWEHVSVKVRVGQYTYTPTWDEMCLIKDLFWTEEDLVMQLHPRKSEAVNFHPNVLHLWRPVCQGHPVNEVCHGHIPEPASELVGPKGRSYLERKGL